MKLLIAFQHKFESTIHTNPSVFQLSVCIRMLGNPVEEGVRWSDIRVCCWGGGRIRLARSWLELGRGKVRTKRPERKRKERSLFPPPPFDISYLSSFSYVPFVATSLTFCQSGVSFQYAYQETSCLRLTFLFKYSIVVIGLT